MSTSTTKFLAEFAEALSDGDGGAIAEMFEIPALVVGDGMLEALTAKNRIEEFFGGAKEQYEQRGIAEAHADVVHEEHPTDKIAIVQVRWPYLDKDGDEIGAESSTYTLRRDDEGDYKIVCIVMHGEEDE
jgi:hypothetical protein